MTHKKVVIVRQYYYLIVLRADCGLDCDVIFHTTFFFGKDILGLRCLLSGDLYVASHATIGAFEALSPTLRDRVILPRGKYRVKDSGWKTLMRVDMVCLAISWSEEAVNWTCHIVYSGSCRQVFRFAYDMWIEEIPIMRKFESPAR